jgi:hypothetical protein
MMEETGVREGILFLDEINCVSETLAPSMLQFLQYKVFGRHRVPDGWIVVTAGNPPEYNNSVREFDTVTWDRLKRIDIEPDYQTWKEFALDRGVHPSVSTYLDIKSSDFYNLLLWDTEYIAYAYGLDSLGNVTTPVSKHIFSTLAPEKENTTFDIEISKQSALAVDKHLRDNQHQSTGRSR